MLFSQRSRSDEFESAALPHMKDLYRTAARVLGNAARAEDVVQEAYLQAWKSFDRFQPGTNCRAWLFKILMHTIHHDRRKWFHARTVQEPEDYFERAAAPGPPVREELTEREILDALAGISQDFREVVLLVDVEEFSYKDAASILNVPIGTVMSRVSRGRKLLRDLLAGVARSYGIGGKAAGEVQSA